MRFYDIDNALKEAVEAGDKPVRVRVEIDRDGGFEAVADRDVVETNFYGLKEVSGGTSARGEVLLENEQGLYPIDGDGAGREVRVSFSLGDGLPWFKRFVFYVDDKGFQDIRGPGRRHMLRLGLRDLSAKLRKTDNSRDWTAPAVFTYSVICDKTQVDKSLVHGIAQRAGLGLADIDCSMILLTLPYVNIKKSVWAELSDLAKAYRAHLECAPEKPLVFAHSPYQSEPLNDDEYSYTFAGESIFYLRKTARNEYYRNTVRLKINLPIALDKQEIWRYEDGPVLYDDFLTPRYPFRSSAIREIQQGNYEARYYVKDYCATPENFRKNRAVVYADFIDSKEDAEQRLMYEGGPFHYSAYDMSTYHDKAVLMLNNDADGDLFNASIHGRPIVLDLNRSCFVRDLGEIQRHETSALNVTGAYFSGDEVQGRPHYEDWTVRELAERLKPKREITLKTHKALFHARVGAKAEVKTAAETLKGVINAFSLRYKRDAAFQAAFRMVEE
jgi:hypothetical protein